MSHTPVRQLVGEVLQQRRIKLFEEAWPGRDALVFGGAGLDHLVGERVLAFGDATDALPRASKDAGQRDIFAVTDSRLAGGTWGDKRFHVVHNQISAFDYKDSMMSSYLKFGTPAGTLEISPLEFMKPLIAFYNGLGRIPVEQRCPPPTALINPSEEDPSGARSAKEALFEPDERIQVLLHALHLLVEKSVPPEVTRDLVARCVIAHRTYAGGTGMKDGEWQSPLSANDLLYTLTGWLGEPVQYQSSDQGVACVDFTVNEKDPRFSRALGRAAVAGAFLSARGIGRAIAGAMFARKPVRHLRFLIRETAPTASYRILNERQEDLHVGRPDFVLRVHAYLEKMSYQVLLLRVLYGWDVPYPQLLATPSEHAQRELTSHVPYGDVSRFV